MAWRIITLSENTAGREGVLAEWGLSTLIDTGEKSYLLDTGATESLVHNLEALEIDHRKIAKIILSHGHYDHTGGLKGLLSRMQRDIEIIAHPDVWTPKYYRKEGKPDRPLSPSFTAAELESLGARFIYTKTPCNLDENMMTSGEVPRVTDFEHIDPAFFIQTPEGWQPDTFVDDLALIIKARAGLVIILGCAHRGMINTIYQARNITGVKKVHMVLGGSHLKDSSEEQIWQTISALNEMGVQKLGTCHCTGMKATLMLAQTYSDDFIFNSTGTIINVS